MPKFQKIKTILETLTDANLTTDLQRSEYTRPIMAKLYGDMRYIHDSTDFLTDYLNWWALRGAEYLKMETAFESEYNPLENYDRTESGSVTREHGNTTVTNGGSLTIDNATDAYNVEIETADYESTYNGTSKTKNPNTHGVQTQTDTRTFDTVQGNDVDTTSMRIHGNIGVTTSQQMITSELVLRQDNLVLQFIAEFVKMHCIGVSAPECEVIDL